MVMNIGTEYIAFVLAMRKDLKDKTTNLTKIVLQIISHFKFMEGNEKSNNIIIQTSTSRSPA